MLLQIVRQESANRFQDAQTFLSAIKAAEDDHGHTSTELNVRKGLFLVLLYSSFEYSVTRAFIEITVLINSANVKCGHLSELLYPLALDPHLMAIASVGRDLKWQKRADLFRKQVSKDAVVLFEGAFLSQMENVWAVTINKIFEVLGIDSPALYDVRVRQYINEVVDKRNAVAHGRESAASIGQSYTTGQLQRLLDELSRQAQYMFSAFETHLFAKSFVKKRFRRFY